MGWRYRLDVEYDGAGFAGWQVQPGRRTAQGTLAAMLASLGERARPTGAGRTDAGVHALGNVAHADLDREWAGEDLLRALNGTAPSDLRVTSARRAAPDFHARFGAIARTYHYAFAAEDDLFFRGRRWAPRALPDATWAAGELAGLAGERDCASLARAGSEARGTRCAIARADWRVRERGALLIVTADRFLWGMVRTLAGTLVAGWAHGEPTGYLERVLARADRQAAPAAAPPEGLYLAAVRYAGEAEADREARTASLAGLGRLMNLEEAGPR